MAITAQMVKELREKTTAGVMDCKKALEETGGDMEKAAAILREKSLAAAAKKVERKAADGRIEPYVHPGNKLATLVEVNCETDFVARTPEFIAFCHDLAMQVAAANPRWVSREEIPADVLDAEKATFSQEIPSDKSAATVAQIMEGKLSKFYRENVLLEQAFIKDESRTIQQLLIEAIAKLGENIIIKRFSRFQIG